MGVTAGNEGLRIRWRDSVLAVSGAGLPVPEVRITYLEAFCRPGSHEREWAETVIPHDTRMKRCDEHGRCLWLESRLSDGVVVEHRITAGADEVDFRLTAFNPSPAASEAHWAQPCLQVGEFAGFGADCDPQAYIANCFIFLNGEPALMPTPTWATRARYMPGQVWCPARVPRPDVNPRPLNPQVPSCGLIGCFSKDRSAILATAWEPYQELFQGVVNCIHSDFRIGGLASGERKEIRGKLYLARGLDELLERYRKDFPEQAG